MSAVGLYGNDVFLATPARYFGKPIQLTMLLRWMADEPPKIGSASESRT